MMVVHAISKLSLDILNHVMSCLPKLSSATMKPVLTIFPCWLASASRNHCSFVGRSRTGICGPRSLEQGYHQSRCYARLRSPNNRLRQTTRLLSNDGSPLSNRPQDPRDRAVHACSALTTRHRGWQRFQNMFDLLVDHQHIGSRPIRSITDVGTDHGLLAIGLALSGRFESVLGVDVSPNSLNNGVQLFDKTQQLLKSDAKENPLASSTETNSSIIPALPLDFRLSDGLKKVQPGEADAVCMAGMGVNLIGNILQASTDTILEVDRLKCQQLILQPTNSRPRNLIKLYDMLQGSGWTLLDERIAFISGRWYLSSCFARFSVSTNATQSSEPAKFPTSKLSLLEEGDPMKVVTRDYWTHHVKWIKMDEEASRNNLHNDDVRWRNWVLDTL